MVSAISSSRDCNPIIIENEKLSKDPILEEIGPLLDQISQNLPINNQDLRNAVKDMSEKVSVDGKLSLSLIIAELKKECDRLDHINSEMLSKSQVRAEKKINDLSNAQARANKNKGHASIGQIVGLVAIVAISITRISAANQKQFMELGSQIASHLGNAYTSYCESEHLRLGNKVQLEQTKYSDRNQKGQASEGGKQDRGRLLTEILQNALSTARVG